MRITACWIVKNEAAGIKRSIESVIDVADELIVVDTGSTDDTVAVCKGLGARVEHFEWIGDFSAARNYALSHASDGIVIMLDADEWFVPRLSHKDRTLLESVFRDDRAAEITHTRININSGGEVLFNDVERRIFRNAPDVRYINKIHEYRPVPSDKTSVLVPNNFTIHHTGYGLDVINEKFKRNIVVLESDLRELEAGGHDYVRTLLYLVRECRGIGDLDKAAEYLTEALRYPDRIKECFKHLGESFATTIYNGIRTAVQKRESFSRRDIRRKLIDVFKYALPNHPSTEEIDLYYHAVLDNKENYLLAGIEPAVQAAAKKPRSITIYQDNEKFLYYMAAAAALRRGDLSRAMGYAASSLNNRLIQQPETLPILLRTVIGQPPAEIVAFLNNILDTENADTLNHLIHETQLDGWKTVNAYYLKKRMEAGDAKGFDAYLGYLRLTRQFDELFNVAFQAYRDSVSAGTIDAGGVSIAIQRREVESAVAARHVFLAILCGAQAGPADVPEGMLDGYGRILNALVAGETLETPTQDDRHILVETYAAVAFDVGAEAAGQYLGVFSADPAFCYRVKASYCENSGLHEFLLRDRMEGIGPLDFSCRRYQIQALTAVGLYEEALAVIQRFLDAETVEQTLLHILQVIAEKAFGETKAAARRIYNRYIELFDTLTDLQDVINTGIPFDDGGVKMAKRLKAMTVAQFYQWVAEESKRAATARLLDAYRRAAGIYAEMNVPVEAARCLCRIVAAEKASREDYAALASVFEGLRNSALAGHFRAISAS